MTSRRAAGVRKPEAYGESAGLLNAYYMHGGRGHRGLARDNAQRALDAGNGSDQQCGTAVRYAVQYGTLAAIGNTAVGVGQGMQNFSPSGSTGNATG